jgi:spermidine/putrescine transport system ATP-binding protein
MRRGKVEQLGPPEDVYENPATEFVAGFLGASNLLEGEVKDLTNGDASILLKAGTTVQVPVDRIPRDSGTRVKVGVRPEKITIDREDLFVPGDANSITGVLRMSTYIGVSHQYKVEGPGGTVLTVYIQNLGAEQAPQPGERVVLSWRPEHTFAVVPQDDLAMEEEEE